MSKKTTVLEQNNNVVAELKNVLSADYTAITHETMLADNADANINDTLFKVFRERQHSRAMVECFAKHSKGIYKVLVNASDFVNFQSNLIEKSEVAHVSRLRYTVKYDNIVALITELCKFDASKQTADKQKATEQKADKQTEKKASAKKASASAKKTHKSA